MTPEPATSWRVLDEATGRTSSVMLAERPKRPGRKPGVKRAHEHLVGLVGHRCDRDSVRVMIGGVETSVIARRAAPSFGERVERRQALLRERGKPQSAESEPPRGQVGLWYADVIHCVPPSGKRVARQLARLAGDDSRVCVPIESLADAVGHRDSAGHESAYARRGVECLVEAGWLRVERTGAGRAIRTTYYLLPGERRVEWFPEDETEWETDRVY